jgi:hypothetical protein
MVRIWPALLSLLMSASISAGEPSQPTKIRNLARGGFSGFQDAAQIVVTNRAQWTEVWKKHSAKQIPAKPAPEVDFEKESVLFVCLGQKRTGGYSAEITALEQSAGKTKVLVKTRAPKPGGMQIQAISSPFHAVAVPRLKGPVAFKFE